MVEGKRMEERVGWAVGLNVAPHLDEASTSSFDSTAISTRTLNSYRSDFIGFSIFGVCLYVSVYLCLCVFLFRLFAFSKCETQRIIFLFLFLRNFKATK